MADSPWNPNKEENNKRWEHSHYETENKNMRKGINKAKTGIVIKTDKVDQPFGKTIEKKEKESKRQREVTENLFQELNVEHHYGFSRH